MGKVDRGKGKPGQKLSWVYRNKKRLGQTKKAEKYSADQVQNRKGRIIIRNLSFKVTEEDIRKHYSKFGEIEEINLLTRPDGSLVGCGFIQFKRVEDASKAIFHTNKKEFLGRTITSDWSIPKSQFSKQMKEKVISTDEESKKPNAEEREDKDGIEDVVENDGKEDSEKVTICNEIANAEKKHKKTKTLTKEERREIKLKRRRKRARIIIRNLSFQATEEALKEHFSKYGNIEEIQILTKPDGRRIGCGFVQFELVQSAAKAIHYANLKPLMGRSVIVDWAVPKNKFGKEIKKENNAETVEIKEEDDVKDEDNASKRDKNNDIEIPENGVEKSNETSSHEDVSDEETDSSIREEDESEQEVDEDNDEDEKKLSIKKEENIEEDEAEEENKPARPRIISNDVNEGKTVFLKNVPFSAKNEDLKQCMEQFGPVYYALVCMDPLTEHSKGTAFVKFQNIEDAEKCLAAGTELKLHDQILDPHRALNRNDVQDKKSLKDKKVTDSRNLYLVKEGAILAGSPAANGVSASDMAKRLQMEQWKSQMLRNLNMFVSRVRLVIHNLPATLDDTKLRQIMKNHAGPKAIIKEARVMRDLRNVDANGVGKSKEFGFVTFTNHEDALKALRSINNNPNVFSPNKRPIVAFSIENRVMVNAKNKRIENSRAKNPLWSANKPTTKGNETSGPKSKKNILESNSGLKRKNGKLENDSNPKRAKGQKTENSEPITENSEEPSYSGTQSKPGQGKMRSKFNLKNQAAVHFQNLKKEKKKVKSAKKKQMKKKEQQLSRKEPKPKQGARKVNKEDANFDKLVNKYKSKLTVVPQTKSKWYET
ncbi:RNA-binding protein 28 [Cephus cinctus]|uniref:RNA-binding protein 28 n=1 Tax=Cephus cinctus TaxID=211228 RepID=A0AAJ7C1E4_CEPCN|nr:RNA-binding protein 28 [Cephus cinctus]